MDELQIIYQQMLPLPAFTDIPDKIPQVYDFQSRGKFVRERMARD
jgi:hypothetical protein